MEWTQERYVEQATQELRDATQKTKGLLRQDKKFHQRQIKSNMVFSWFCTDNQTTNGENLISKVELDEDEEDANTAEAAADNSDSKFRQSCCEGVEQWGILFALL